MTETDLPPTTNIGVLADILYRNAIDFVRRGGESDNQGALYVTEFAFPFWISLDDDDKHLRFHTYIDAAGNGDEIEFLRFVNRLNERYIFIQFHIDLRLGRLCGTYMLPARPGISSTQLLILTRLFPAIFAEATASRNEDGEVVPWADRDQPAFTITGVD